MFRVRTITHNIFSKHTKEAEMLSLSENKRYGVGVFVLVGKYFIMKAFLCLYYHCFVSLLMWLTKFFFRRSVISYGAHINFLFSQHSPENRSPPVNTGTNTQHLDSEFHSDIQTFGK